MFKLSRLTDYAVVVLAEMAKNSDELLSAATLSARAGLPEPTVSKILKLMTKQGVIESVRGAGGGYSLKDKADKVPVTDIITAIEGPIALTSCVGAGDDSCAYEGFCTMHGRWDVVNAAITDALKEVTLADMTMGGEIKEKPW